MIIPFHLKTIVHQLLQGEIIIYPTDTVYGIIASVSSPDKIKEINLLKQRATNQPIALLVASEDDLRSYVTLKPETLAVWRKYNTTTLSTTIIFSAQKQFASNYITWTPPTIGIRQTLDPNLQKIIHRIGPLWATSANLHNDSTLNDPYKLADIFQNQNVVIYKEPYEHKQPSRIYCSITNKWIR